MTDNCQTRRMYGHNYAVPGGAIYGRYAPARADLKSGRIEYEHLQCGIIWNTNPPERIWITNPNIKCSRITNPPEQKKLEAQEPVEKNWSPFGMQR